MERRDLIVGVLVAASGGFGIAAPQNLAPDPTKQLLLDARVVQSVQNAKLTLGTVEKEARNPLFHADKPWENALNNLYPNVLWDEREQLFKLWYKCVLTDKDVIAKMANPTTIHDQGWFLLYATSRDGLTWEKPELGQFEFDGSRANNAVARDTPNVGVFRDPHDPDASRRFKMVYDVGLGKLRTRTSPDGLRWSEPQEPVGFSAFHGDTHNNAFWDERAGRYVWITKAYLGERLVARVESTDFVHWTSTGVVMRSSLTEGRAHQTYCMPVFPYANGYVGYLMMYHVRDGRTVDCELVWSPDSVSWTRIAPGVPFIPRGPKGCCDSSCIYAPSGPAIAQDGRMLIYYGGDSFPHQGWKRHCLPCLARLRVDGFAGYESSMPGADAAITTQPMRVSGPIQISADVRPGGALRVSLLDDPEFGQAASNAIVHDVTDGEVQWPGKDSASLRGKVVRLKFELRDAKLYAFRGALLVGAPQITTGIRHFPQTLEVGLTTPNAPAGARIRFTTDGSAASAASAEWRAPRKLTQTTRLRARTFLPGVANGGAELDETFTHLESRRVPLPESKLSFTFDESSSGWRGTNRVDYCATAGVTGGYITATRDGGLSPIAFFPSDAPDWPKRFGGSGAEIAFQMRSLIGGGGYQLELFAGDVAAWSFARFPKLTNGWQRAAVGVRWDWNDAEAEAAGWVRGRAAFSWRETITHLGKVVIVAGDGPATPSFDLDDFAVEPFADSM